MRQAYESDPVARVAVLSKLFDSFTMLVDMLGLLSAEERVAIAESLFMSFQKEPATGTALSHENLVVLLDSLIRATKEMN